MCVLSVHIFVVILFLCELSICGEIRLLSNDFLLAGIESAEILETNEDAERIYRQNEPTALLKVTYTKPETFHTEWSWLTKTLYKELTYIKSKLLDSVKHFTSNLTVGNITETIEVETLLNNSGIYTFSIVDPSTNTTVQSANFTLKIAAAPVKVKLLSDFRVSKKLRRGSAIVFECSAIGYPLPTITWESNACGKFELLADRCGKTKPKWKPLEMIDNFTQIDATYSRSQQVDIMSSQIGRIRCTAENSEGRGVSEGLSLTPNNHDLAEMFLAKRYLVKFTINPRNGGQTVAYRGDQFNLTCEMPLAESDSDGKVLVWSKGLPDGTNRTLASQSGFEYNSYELDKRYQLSYEIGDNVDLNRYTLTINNISATDAGLYRCETSFFGKQLRRSVNITVIDSFAPIIVASDSEILVEPAMSLKIPCKVVGVPPPTVIWYKDGRILDARQNSNIIVKPDSLEFLRICESDAGEYVCEATNKVGRARRSFQLTLKTFFHQHKTAMIVAIVIGPVVIICIIVIIRLALINTWGRHNLHRLELELRSNEQNEFDPTLPIFDVINSGPKIKPGYPHCLKVDSLIMDRQNVVKLGDGEFGIVLQVKLRKCDGTEERVALKRPKNNFEVDQYRMLFKEICLMTYLRKHPNIVNMIGYVSHISKGQLYMVMELCNDGSLKNLLNSIRQDFRAKFYSELRSENKNDSDGERYVTEVFPDWPSIKASLKPKGFVFHSDLISYAYQIASAMVYLAEINFVHRDLAARNVLLSHNFKVAKIADFGLSHQIYRNYKFFETPKDLKLPFRWTPPEFLIYGEFSSGSDVWSFGVVLSEIFSLLPTYPIENLTPENC